MVLTGFVAADAQHDRKLARVQQHSRGLDRFGRWLGRARSRSSMGLICGPVEAGAGEHLTPAAVFGRGGGRDGGDPVEPGGHHERGRETLTHPLGRGLGRGQGHHVEPDARRRDCPRIASSDCSRKLRLGSAISSGSRYRQRHGTMISVGGSSAARRPSAGCRLIVGPSEGPVLFDRAQGAQRRVIGGPPDEGDVVVALPPPRGLAGDPLDPGGDLGASGVVEVDQHLIGQHPNGRPSAAGNHQRV